MKTDTIPATIYLSDGTAVLVDEEDVSMLSKFRWVPIGQNRYAGFYSKDAVRTTKVVMMHRVIMNAQQGQMVDHKDGNPYNNQKSNLRFCTHAENMRNRKLRRDSQSGIKGVRRFCWHGGLKWQARIRFNGKRFHLGYFQTKEEAAEKYSEAALQLHGEFARLK